MKHAMCLFKAFVLFFVLCSTILVVSGSTVINTDGELVIEGNIQCSTKPFIKSHTECFYVSLNNSASTDITVTVDFYIWDEDDEEYEWFGYSACTVSAKTVVDTDKENVSLLWPGTWKEEPWGLYWPGRFIPRYMKVTAEYDGDIVDTQENRFFMGFVIF